MSQQRLYCIQRKFKDSDEFAFWVTSSRKNNYFVTSVFGAYCFTDGLVLEFMKTKIHDDYVVWEREFIFAQLQDDDSILLKALIKPESKFIPRGGRGSNKTPIEVYPPPTTEEFPSLDSLGEPELDPLALLNHIEPNGKWPRGKKSPIDISKCETSGGGDGGSKLPIGRGENPKPKYHREILPGVWVDVYDVIGAFGVTDGGYQHALKKMLATGKRGHKDETQDRKDILASILRSDERFALFGEKS